jgi:hypothetical protein
MYAVIYAILLPACSFAMALFGFFVGRCARKLPIIDDNLPWTMHRSQIPPIIEVSQYPPTPTSSAVASNPQSIRLIIDSRQADQLLYDHWREQFVAALALQDSSR